MSEAKARAPAASEAYSEVDDSEEESEESEDHQEKIKISRRRTCQFVYKLHNIVTSASEHPTDHATVRFSEDGSYFTIFDRSLFEKDILPRVGYRGQVFTYPCCSLVYVLTLARKYFKMI